jgi:hypothetical protein
VIFEEPTKGFPWEVSSAMDGHSLTALRRPHGSAHRQCHLFNRESLVCRLSIIALSHESPYDLDEGLSAMEFVLEHPE